MTKIPGEALCGFADLFEEPRPLIGARRAGRPGAKPGAQAGKPAPGARGRPSGASVSVKRVRPKTKSPHVAALAKAASAGQAAVAKAQKAVEVLRAKRPGRLLVSKSALTVRKGKAVVVGDEAFVSGEFGESGVASEEMLFGDGGDGEMLGAAPKKKRRLTSKQKEKLGKHATAVAKHTKAAKVLASVAAKAKRVGAAATGFAKQTAPWIKRKLQGPGTLPGGPRTAEIRGLGEFGPASEEMLFGDDDPLTLLGQDGEWLDETDSGSGETDLDLGIPGGDEGQDVAPDPALESFGLDSAGRVRAPDGRVLYDPNKDPSLQPLPKRGETISSEEAKAEFKSVPEDAVVYEGPFPWDSIGSHSVFYGTHRGPIPLHGPLRAPGSAGTSRGDGFLWGHPDRWFFRDPPSKGKDGFFPTGKTGATAQFKGAVKDVIDSIFSESIRHGWGPIVGNPKSDLAGLQYASGKFFWQSRFAPKHMTQEADEKIKLANAETVAANQSAAQIEAAQIAKDLNARAEEQSRKEAEAALREKEAESKAREAETGTREAEAKARAEQAALETRRQEQEIEEKRAATEEQRRLAEEDREQRRVQREEDAAQRKEEAERRREETARAREEEAERRREEAELRREEAPRLREEEAERRREEAEERQRQMEERRRQMEEARLAPARPAYPTAPALPSAAPEEVFDETTTFDDEAAFDEAAFDEIVSSGTGEILGINIDPS